MDVQELNTQADRFVQKIKHHIIISSGRTINKVSSEELYQAFATVLREEVAINWSATTETYLQKRVRTLYYLSMEYLPGRQLCNSITNMHAQELVRAVLKKINREYKDLAESEPDPGLGNGGLGRLASCFLDSLATMHYPARGYGLRYHYGIFEQEIWNGVQVERPDYWLLNNNPWESRNDSQSVSIHFGGHPVLEKNRNGEDVFLIEGFEEVRALPYDTPVIGYSSHSAFSVLTLRLWSTKESPRNFRLQRFNAGFLDQATENISLTDVLYPNDQSELGKRVRLKQEFLLVSASLQDIIRSHLNLYGELSNFADKVRIQINDTHPALIIAELIRTLTKNYDFSWKNALETTLACCSYTNHTILREALEEWNERRIHTLLPRQHLIIQKLNLDFCNSVRERFPNDEERVRRMSIIEKGQIRMAHLAMVGSHKINGVAKLHTEILKTKIFPDFYAMFPEKFENVTNGVTQRRWLNCCNPQLSSLITKCIGPDWIDNFSLVAKLVPYAKEREIQKEFLRIKKENKELLLNFLARDNPIRDAQGKILEHSSPLEASALFSVQVKRFHEYKRQLLNALHLIMLYQEDLHVDRVPRFVIIGGKTAPGYRQAKQIIQLTCCIARKIKQNKSFKNRLSVSFVENYNVTKAALIIPAADLSEQISTAGWEASGTGNMKFSMNGALTIGTEDGANIELHQSIGEKWWPFSFGCSAKENSESTNVQGWDIYNQDEAIRKAVDALADGTFSENQEESSVFSSLRNALLGEDPFFVLRDLRAYFETQKRVEELYRSPFLWAETALHNIAAMGFFSSDRSIQEYAQKIWGIAPCPPDTSTLNHIRKEYFEHDRCHILT